MGEAVFITGAADFIGSALAARLRDEGAEVRGVDMGADAAAGIVAGDVTRPDAWGEHVRGAGVVIHTAAVVSNAVGLDRQWEVNVGGTRRALEAAVRAGAERFVLLSSIRAFSDLGFPDGVEESHPVRPDGNPYVDTKIAAEQVALQAHAAGEIAVTIIRPGDVYGPRSRLRPLRPHARPRRRALRADAGGAGAGGSRLGRRAPARQHDRGQPHRRALPHPPRDLLDRQGPEGARLRAAGGPRGGVERTEAWLREEELL